jgi:two-component system chemotaxis response regulator CheY
MTMPILIVDDYNTMVRIVRNLLRQLGFSNIDEASDANAALTKLRAKDYALVISDARMSPMSGMDLLARIRAEGRTRQPPFVMITNDDSEAAEVRARAAAAIVKPFDAAALKQKLEPVIGAF